MARHHHRLGHRDIVRQRLHFVGPFEGPGVTIGDLSLPVMSNNPSGAKIFRSTSAIQIDALRGQVKQIDQVVQGARTQVASLLESVKLLHSMQTEGGCHQAEGEESIAAASPPHQPYLAFEPTIPPPGWLQAELRGVKKKLATLQHHVPQDLILTWMAVL